MTKFTVGRPITTQVPEVLVDAGLPDGQHRFRLVVIGSAGNSSTPDDLVLSISRVVLPTGLGTGTVGTTVPPVLQPVTPVVPVVPLVPVVPVLPVRPPVPQPTIPPRRPRGRDRSDP
ncbi:hypothetical protein BurJ1DRAFT_2331 [Burkholderiales bacterium JOSHI_001]|nr:hypothetical protein BurJ1DRAFT_2331 [Burkholderiales bacterium JOSHI_001]